MADDHDDFNHDTVFYVALFIAGTVLVLGVIGFMLNVG